jgi:hypothetical protein
VSQRSVWEWWGYSQKGSMAVVGDAGLTDLQMKDVVRLEDRSFSVSGISDQPTLMKMYLK